ncbi:MAG: inorganic phosphate transporter [Candidatus Heimdallarchaeota archaeon]|nr:inorganic phosphate transporter [Candidatus Heimdallarchaeota archaeon]
MVDIILIIMIVTSVLLSFAIGTNDETFAPVVGVKRLPVKTAVILGAIVAIIGAFLFTPKISNTLNNHISTIQLSSDNLLIFAVLTSMAISLILASVFGLPISSTEAMVGSILALSLVHGESIHWGWDGMGKVFLTWVISPVLGFFGSFILMKLVRKILRKSVRGLSNLETSNAITGSFLLLMVVITGLSRAGNDISNAIAPIYPLFQDSTKSIFYQSLPLLIGSIGLGVGLMTIGWRVLKKLGNDVVELTPESAFVTQASAALITLVAVSLGIPVSGTMILVSSFIGAGYGDKKPINLKSVRHIVLFVFLTPIISGLCAIAFYYIFQGVF